MANQTSSSSSTRKLQPFSFIDEDAGSESSQTVFAPLEPESTVSANANVNSTNQSSKRRNKNGQQSASNVTQNQNQDQDQNQIRSRTRKTANNIDLTTFSSDINVNGNGNGTYFPSESDLRTKSTNNNSSSSATNVPAWFTNDSVNTAWAHPDEDLFGELEPGGGGGGGGGTSSRSRKISATAAGGKKAATGGGGERRSKQQQQQQQLQLQQQQYQLQQQQQKGQQYQNGTDPAASKGAAAGGVGGRPEKWESDEEFKGVLDDLSSRFILNLPEEELESAERICFQVEQAHWFYEDFVREDSPNLPSYTLKRFSEIFFRYCPFLSHWSDEHERAFERFMQYKSRVPVCGAILINEDWDKCVLVKGWKSSASWGFPKGKINNEESKPDCAIREVLEETGYDCADLLDAEDFIDFTMNDQRMTLFIVTDVPEDTIFKTQTRKEISAIQWFKLTDLPTWKKTKNGNVDSSTGNKKYRFYMIAPFVSPLKQWIKLNKQYDAQAAAAQDMTPELDRVEPVGAHVVLPNSGGGHQDTSESDLSATISTSQAHHGPHHSGHTMESVDSNTSANGMSELDQLFKRFLTSEARPATPVMAHPDPAMQLILQKLSSPAPAPASPQSQFQHNRPPTFGSPSPQPSFYAQQYQQPSSQQAGNGQNNQNGTLDGPIMLSAPNSDAHAHQRAAAGPMQPPRPYHPVAEGQVHPMQQPPFPLPFPGALPHQIHEGPPHQQFMQAQQHQSRMIPQQQAPVPLQHQSNNQGNLQYPSPGPPQMFPNPHTMHGVQPFPNMQHPSMPVPGTNIPGPPLPQMQGYRQPPQFAPPPPPPQQQSWVQQSQPHPMRPNQPPAQFNSPPPPASTIHGSYGSPVRQPQFQPSATKSPLSTNASATSASQLLSMLSGGK